MAARRQQFSPQWTATGLQRRLVTVAAAALFTALLLGRAETMLLVAPLVGALLAGLLRTPPATVDIEWTVEPLRALEGEAFIVRATVDPPAGRLTGELTPGRLPHRQEVTTERGVVEWTITPLRWGRWPIGPLRLRITAPTGLASAELVLPLDSLTVYPAAPHLDAVPVADRLTRQIGEHVAARAGRGGEFAAVRAMQPGDSARAINWSVSSRRDEPYVNERWAEQALDLVVAVDTFSDVGPPGRRSLDLAVRGAAAAARGYLRSHDRVGLVALGGLLRWLRPDASGRQLYRIVDYLLDLPDVHSVVDPDVDRIPRQALPPGALVVVFSPLLDPRVEAMIRDLRERGFPLIVVDVLTAEPPTPPGETAQLALRMWRLDRQARRHDFAELGIPVLPWDGVEALNDVLAPIRRTRLRGAAR